MENDRLRKVWRGENKNEQKDGSLLFGRTPVFMPFWMKKKQTRFNTLAIRFDITKT